MGKRVKPDATRITRAREDGVAEQGVRRCAQLMTDGLWETGRSAALVAAELGASPRTAEAWATTASRALRLAIGDGEELRARLALMLERHERVAMGLSDVKAATGAVKALGELMGLVTQKHEHAVVVAQYEQLPRDGKARWLREKAAALLAEADRLDGVVSVEVDAVDPP